MANDKQKQLLTKVMNADAKDGLYEHVPDAGKMISAVDYLAAKMPQIDWNDPYYRNILQQAKQIEQDRETEFKAAFEQAVINAFHAGQRMGMYNTSVITAQGQMTTGQQYFNQTHISNQ